MNAELRSDHCRATRNRAKVSATPQELSQGKMRRLRRAEAKVTRGSWRVVRGLASKEQKQRAENYLDDEDLPPEEVEQEFHEFDEHIAALALHGFISKHFPHGLQAQSLTEFYNAYPAEGMILRCRKPKKFCLTYSSLFVWYDTPHPGLIKAAASSVADNGKKMLARALGGDTGVVQYHPPEPKPSPRPPPNSTLGRVDRLGWGEGGGFGSPIFKPPPKEDCWLLTYHCRSRMEERGIGKREVRRALIHGVRKIAKGGRLSHVHDGLVVITDLTRSWIITCYRPEVDSSSDEEEPDGAAEAGTEVGGVAEDVLLTAEEEPQAGAAGEAEAETEAAAEPEAEDLDGTSQKAPRKRVPMRVRLVAAEARVAQLEKIIMAAGLEVPAPCP